MRPEDGDSSHGSRHPCGVWVYSVASPDTNCSDIRLGGRESWVAADTLPVRRRRWRTYECEATCSRLHIGMAHCYCEPAVRGADDVLFDLHNVSIVTERPAIFSLICEPEKL